MSSASPSRPGGRLHFLRWIAASAFAFLASSCQLPQGPATPGPGGEPAPAPTPQDLPIVRGQPLLGVDSYIVVEARTRKILAHGNADKKRQVASLTKLATALVVLDWQKLTGVSLDTRLVVPPTAAPEVMGGANPLGLRPGDQLSLRDALYASLMASDNVSGEALADFVGRDLLTRRGLAGDPVERFLEQMNTLAGKLGMDSTKFTNPHGLDHYRRKGHSTAADMARLAVYGVENPALRFYTSQKTRQVTIHRGGVRAERLRLSNTNELVGREGVDGIKTGMTGLAGPCLISSATKAPVIDTDAEGRKRITPRRLVVVVLGAQDRFGLSRHLLRQGWAQYDQWYAGGMQILDARELLTNF